MRRCPRFFPNPASARCDTGGIFTKTLLIGLFFLLLTPHAGNAQQNSPMDVSAITWISDEYAPYTVNQEGKQAGIAVEVLRAVLRTLGKPSPDRVRILPWSRAYRTALETPASCLFVVARTPSRETCFKWAGPIMPAVTGLIARKDRQVRIHTPADISQYTVAALPQDMGHRLLLELGYPENRLVLTTFPPGIVEMMNRGRIDAWAYDIVAADSLIRAAGFSPNEYEAVFPLREAYMYYAFHKSVPDAAVASFQGALDQLRESGELATIVQQYGLVPFAAGPRLPLLVQPTAVRIE